MKVPANWDSYKARSGRSGGKGGQKSPAAGAYIAVITDCAEKPSRFGGFSLAINLDIAQGEFKGFYQNRHDRHPDWSWGCTYWVQLPNDSDLEKDTRTAWKFKTFIGNVEKSNPGYEWDWMPSGLIGKQIGMVFQDREYDFIDDQTGEEKNGMRPVPAASYTVQDVQEGKATILPPKYLNDHGNGNAGGGFGGDSGNYAGNAGNSGGMSYGQQSGYAPMQNGGQQQNTGYQQQPAEEDDSEFRELEDDDSDLPF